VPTLPSLLSEIELGTFLRYSPSGTSEVSKRSRAWRDAVKAGKPDWIGLALDHLREALEPSGLRRFLGPDVILVPVPRSAPLSEPEALWPGRLICEGLIERGLGKEVLPCVERTEAVPKSAFAERGGRPTTERHLETMRIERALFAPRRITLVDDIVTIGRTILAAGSHVRAANPDAELRAFALIHTYGLTGDVEKIEMPYVGALKRTGGWIGHDPPQ
jgi:hypothetical protein